MPTKFITLAEAADRLSLSERTIRRHISAGAIKAYGIGRAVRIREADLETALRPITPSGAR
ncbi:helix-turn-helix domain-containing protein [Mycobacterium sp.]|uniref:helix-turn-helix domain-containing protein n=1 Tax=Mycobacterium sp. TaxID=1785 RepID=UPI003F9A305B